MLYSDELLQTRNVTKYDWNCYENQGVYINFINEFTQRNVTCLLMLVTKADSGAIIIIVLRSVGKLWNKYYS